MITRRSLLCTLPIAAAAQPALSAASGLKITGFRVHKAACRWRQIVLLEILTDGGLTGIGEASIPRRAPLVEEALLWLEKRMVGQDPAGPQRHWWRNYWDLSRWRDGAILFTALAGVDIALHDLEGKRLGVPVSRLLGGPMRDDFRVYYTHWPGARGAPSAAEIAARAAADKATGWTAVKFGIPAAPDEKEAARRTVGLLRAIREGAGDDFDIGLEIAERFTLRQALYFAEAVAPYRPMFIEEPLWRENPVPFTELAAKSPVPIATGEGHLSRNAFRPLLEARGAQIIQPDVLHCGGITELTKIADYAHTFGVEVAPHQCYGPLGHVASLHAMSVARNFFIHEWEGEDDHVFRELTGGTYPTQHGGRVGLPSGPGLGITLDIEAFLERFPYRDIL